MKKVYEYEADVMNFHLNEKNPIVRLEFARKCQLKNLKFDKKVRLTVPNSLKCRIWTASHPYDSGTVDRPNLGSYQSFETY